MSTTAKYLRTGLLTRLGEVAGLADAAVARLENAEALEAARLALALDAAGVALRFLGQLLACLPAKGGQHAAVGGRSL
jgi:hypothetical protein